MAKKKWYRNDALIRTARDVAMFVVGLGGVIFETITPADARPILVGVFAAMMGLPLFMRSDEKRNGDQ